MTDQLTHLLLSIQRGIENGTITGVSLATRTGLRDLLVARTHHDTRQPRPIQQIDISHLDHDMAAEMVLWGMRLVRAAGFAVVRLDQAEAMNSMYATSGENWPEAMVAGIHPGSSLETAFGRLPPEKLECMSTAFLSGCYDMVNGKWGLTSAQLPAPAARVIVDAANQPTTSMTAQTQTSTLTPMQQQWNQLGDTPVDADGRIEEAFLHFPAGTDREDIWRWFEAQYPDFVAGEAPRFFAL